MALTLEAALQAGELATRIMARQQKIKLIENMISQGWVIDQFSAVGPDNADTGLLLERLDAETSATALRFTLQIYQAQLDGLTKQLESI